MNLTVKYHQAIFALVWTCIGGVAAADVTFEVCYDFGCRHRSEVTLNAREWTSVKALFSSSNAAEERQQIKLAIGRLETLTGRRTPTYRDYGGNLPTLKGDAQIEFFPGQLDCIDESINTTRYLELLEHAGVLKFHRVRDRVYRRSFLAQHWAAQIEDHTTGRRYVVDSWFEDNGKPPILVSSENWHDLSL